MRIFNWLFSQPYLLLFLATLFWAGNAIAGKLAVGHISPFLLTSIRWFVTVLLILPFAMPHLKKDWQVLRPNLLFLFILGSLGFSTFNNMMYMSLTMTSAMNVAIVQASLPFFVFLLNFIIYRLNPTLFQIVGFPITVIGVLMITSKGSLEVLQSLTFNMGDLLMIAAIAVYGVYSVFLNKKPDVHWLSFIAVLATSAFIISLFYSGYEVATDTAIWPDLTGTLIVFYTAIFPSILSQVFWIRSVELIGSNSSAIWINVVPVFGTLLAILIVGERFQIFHGLGMLLIIGGVWIAQRKKTNP